MSGPKTNERPGTRAQVKYVRMSAYKAREVLDLVRGVAVDEARAILAYTERAAAEVIGKCLESAVANAEHNDQIDPETLYVAACYADEGRTLYRFRPRARGRATRVRKRTCHITVIVATMPADMLAREQARKEAIPGSRAARRRGQEAAERAARVARSRAAEAESDETTDDEPAADEVVDTTAEAAEIADAAMADADATDAAEPTAEVPDEPETEPAATAADEEIVDTTAEAAGDETADAADDDEKDD